MTILDNTGGYSRPLYESALALWQAREARTEPRLRRMQPDNFDMHSGAFALVCADAAAVITRLRDLGFINDIGLVAIKAEEQSNKASSEGVK